MPPVRLRDVMKRLNAWSVLQPVFQFSRSAMALWRAAIREPLRWPGKVLPNSLPLISLYKTND
jgi:hypothetical protein